MAARCEQRPRERGCGWSESLLLHLTGVANRPRTHNKKNTTFNKNAVLVDNSAQCITTHTCRPTQVEARVTHRSNSLGTFQLYERVIWCLSACVPAPEVTVCVGGAVGVLADDRSLLQGGGGAQTPPRALRFKQSQLKATCLHRVTCTCLIKRLTLPSPTDWSPRRGSYWRSTAPCPPADSSPRRRPPAAFSPHLRRRAADT